MSNPVSHPARSGGSRVPIPPAHVLHEPYVIFLLLFIVLPASELALLLEVGKRIGTIETLALIVITGIVGAALARHQGLQVLQQVERETREGRMPGGALVDGVIILIAAALLVTPGVLTDAFGFLCLIPLTRRIMKATVVRWFERRIQSGDGGMKIYFSHGEGPETGPRRVRDITPDDAPRRVRDITPDDDERGR